MQTFDEALRVLNGRDRRKLCNNTYLVRLDADEIGVLLHSTYVVKYKANGSIRVYSGGYHSKTTKDRINSYSPASITQKNYKWSCNGQPFEEGMEVGSPPPPGQTEQQFLNQFDQHVETILGNKRANALFH